MVKKIIWSERAINERTEILQYWINRNKSKIYSLKLNALIKEEVNVLGKFPMIGKDTDVTNVKVKIIKDYLLYYEIKNNELHILTIRDGRQNPKLFKIRENS